MYNAVLEEAFSRVTAKLRLTFLEAVLYAAFTGTTMQANYVLFITFWQ